MENFVQDLLIRFRLAFKLDRSVFRGRGDVEVDASQISFSFELDQLGEELLVFLDVLDHLLTAGEAIVVAWSVAVRTWDKFGCRDVVAGQTSRFNLERGTAGLFANVSRV